jgi:hypothetical protein
MSHFISLEIVRPGSEFQKEYLKGEPTPVVPHEMEMVFEELLRHAE